MFKLLQRSIIKNIPKRTNNVINTRNFLSQAYLCQEVWDRRLNSSILQKINIDEFYYELDQRYQKTRELSAVDVDIFSNAIKGEKCVDELLDIVHKLRLTAETGNTLNSTTHAVIRILMNTESLENLVNVIDDRLNFGIFLDYYTANILMDLCWKRKDYTSGARIASQLMLQEEFDHPLSYNLSLLLCYKYLLNPEGWPVYPQPEEPEEEVKVRVKYIRNPFDDEHFDLRDPNKIVGKTLALFTKGKLDSLNLSFNILGNALFGKQEEIIKATTSAKDKNIVLCKEILDLIPNDTDAKKLVADLKQESKDVEKDLLENVEKAVQITSERDIADQCKLFLQWEEERQKALDMQKTRLSKINRLNEIEDLQKALKEKETRLWFFENEEKLELTIEEKESMIPQSQIVTKQENDDNYVPPEVQKKRI